MVWYCYLIVTSQENGSHKFIFLPFCHYHSSSIIWKHQNCVFSFHNLNSKFWVLSDRNKHPKSSQTLHHSWDPQVLNDGSWKLSDITQFLDYPNKLLEHSQLEMPSYLILPSQKAILSIIPYHFTIFPTSQLLFSHSTH